MTKHGKIGMGLALFSLGTSALEAVMLERKGKTKEAAIVVGMAFLAAVRFKDRYESGYFK